MDLCKPLVGESRLYLTIFIQTQKVGYEERKVKGKGQDLELHRVTFFDQLSHPKMV